METINTIETKHARKMYFWLFSKRVSVIFFFLVLLIYLPIYAYIWPHKILWIALLVFLFVEGFGAFISTNFIQQAWRPFFLSKYGIKTLGVVTRRSFAHDIGGISSFNGIQAQVEFVTDTGSERLWFLFTDQDAVLGSNVPLLYNPYRPAHARRDIPLSGLKGKVELGSMILGVLCFVFSLLLLIIFSLSY